MAMKQKASSESGSPRESGGSGLVTDHHPTALQVERLEGDGWPMDVRLPEEKWAPETAKLSSPVQVLTPKQNVQQPRKNVLSRCWLTPSGKAKPKPDCKSTSPPHTH